MVEEENSVKARKLEERIKEMVSRTVQKQNKEELEEILLRLRLMNGLFEPPYLYSESDDKRLKGLIRHCEGRILQTLGRFNEAIEKLQEAVELRKEDPIGHGHSKFQLFICKDYAGIPISSEEIDETWEATWKMMRAASQDNDMKTHGDAIHNLGYIKFKTRDVKEAIDYYLWARVVREVANDRQGLALTWARLAECYKIIGDNVKARQYGEKALKYFEKVGDVERIKQVKNNVFDEEVK